MTILEKFREDLYYGTNDRVWPWNIDPNISEDSLMSFACPSDFYDIPDINGCDRYDEDRCRRCWNREFKED